MLLFVLLFMLLFVFAFAEEFVEGTFSVGILGEFIDAREFTDGAALCLDVNDPILSIL